ncbi:hypothetical protein Daura_39285 [Dactylosporangium aurantiacum]|uniref:Uncharacterized protein n=1 Tax=Dactylosporangium aurantiacum TaxID=35754 RepID=A0A9Q9IEM2_9ACTN|nr:hypothetical protein [Dactylosporangium aurantiacum]MDG6101532.1 hypothetical protein [Dactylosporangium aurantiacum]UWZ52627.1 hypothetical protein Daura_39285 [Dactylosporangium aurantiacum]
MRRLVIVVLLALGAAGLALAVPAVRAAVHDLACPATFTAYARQPLPDVPVVTATHLAVVGDRFAVGGHRDPMPAGRPPVEGDASLVRYEHAETSPTEQRCGRVVAGYRYHVYTATRAGAVVIDGHLVRISARP